MKVTHVQTGDRIITPSAPMVHVVIWDGSRAWETACGLEDYQPDYALFDECRIGYTALELHRAPDDAPVTCLLCLISTWHPPDGPPWLL